MEGLREQVATNSKDIETLKSEVSSLKTRIAVAENNISAIQSTLNKIDANTTRLLWIVVTAVIGTVLKTSGLF